MDIQRLRNLTTGRLHTKIEHVYEDIALITGVMTHQLPNALEAIEAYLREQLTNVRFWDGKYDPTHIGEIEVPPMDKEAQDAMWKRYGELPDFINTCDET
ncbi:MAG: DUF7736 domain-containing protein [Methylobacter sp.]